MNTKKIIKYTMLFIALCVLVVVILVNTNYVKSKVDLNAENYRKAIIKQADNVKNNIINKRVNGIKRIITNLSFKNRIVLYVYNGYDCSSCIDKGFQEAKMIDSMLVDKCVYVIGSSSNVAADQINSGYRKYIYYDEHDILRKELFYMKTPVMLLLDKNLIIKDVYFLFNFDTQEMYSRFINSIKQSE